MCAFSRWLGVAARTRSGCGRRRARLRERSKCIPCQICNRRIQVGIHVEMTIFLPPIRASGLRVCRAATTIYFVPERYDAFVAMHFYALLLTCLVAHTTSCTKRG